MKPIAFSVFLGITISSLFVSLASLAQHSISRKELTDLQKTEALLSQMTLDEKIGQMTQVTLGVVSPSEDGVLDPASLKKAILDYKVGSVLNVTNHALSVEQWHLVLTAIQDEASGTRLKIPVIYGKRRVG